ncbi:MAG: 2-dehydropantoate 2-reductase [Myxococcaceae bacterium]|nr:2-dehydropantoate 2-reductase [Myxococcaceae bacterium]
MTPLRVGVLGAGAVGCYVGGFLACEGADVVLVGRERVKTELETYGLTVSDLARGASRVVPKERFVVADATALTACDVVLCCVKSAQTAEAAAQLAPVLSPGAIVVSLQNGIHNAEVLRDKLQKHTVLGGIVGFNVVGKGEGVYRQATSGPLVIERSSEPGRLAPLVTLLERARFELEVVKDIRPMQWSKLVINLNNAVSALSDRPTVELVFDKGYRRILAATMGEAIAVLRLAKTPLARVGPLPVTLFPLMLRLPSPLVRVLASAQVKIDPEARSSMWEDLARGRPTEVDWLNGEIVRLADSCGARAPLNARMVEIVHEAEKRGAGSPKLSADALWASLTRA